MILKLLLNTQMIRMMFVKTLKNTVQTRNAINCFIRGRKLNISLVFIAQDYFAVPSCNLIIHQILTLKIL